MLSLLVLGAHFLRAGNLLLVLLVVAAAALPLVRQPWATRAVQVILVLGALEWLRTLALLVGERQLAGVPYTRLAIILGAVAGFTLLSAVLVRARRATAHVPG
jgi:hypothetical protein